MGRLAQSQSQRGGTNLSRLNATRWFLLVVLMFCVALPVWSQSGRRNEPGKGAKTPPGPIADPNRPSSGTSIPRSTSGNEVDDGDVVRITSNLVPIPVSVVDNLGRAVVNLKLDDFELRVDGTVRPLADLTRSETSVKLALLFD